MPPTDASAEGSSSNELACTSCRNRKLKCDRVKPACTRCAKFQGECVYPESRRKPAFKRRNVKELEARLAQVEDLLKQSGDKDSGEEKADEIFDFNFADFAPTTEDVFLQGMDYTLPSVPIEGGAMFSMPQADPSMPFTAADGTQTSGAAFGTELFGLGMSETLPPFEVTEELNRIFFERQQHFIPIVQPARYYQAYYSTPHMKPPMCLQYAIWTLASNGHEQYGHLHDIFYQRARQYAEADELKGFGEHFITVQHAQAWALITTDEAKCMLFTRAAMSGARAIRLAHMMGLHRLDGNDEDLSPTLMPPKDWVELEERRRTFWGIFCLDSHSSVSTGWPHLIDPCEITTHLPASESAFVSGEPMETCMLHEAFKGPSYSSFAGAILVCHLFNQIMRHVHRPGREDHPENYEYGEYWQRHRGIDNTISSAFMFLPEHFRLPEHYRDPTAVHTNLNYHASLICLHLAALERIDDYKLADHAKIASESRLFTAAQEIVNIMKMTSHLKTNPRSPMAAVALYCAASVFIYQCKANPSPKNIDNLDFIVVAMEAIGREHIITRAFLKQLLVDIELNNITQIGRPPSVDDMPNTITVGNHRIPLLARTHINRHSSRPQPPLPGRLPLGKPQGIVNPHRMRECGIGWGSSIKDNGTGAGLCTYAGDHGLKSMLGQDTTPGSIIPDEGNAAKRKRGSHGDASTTEPGQDQDPLLWGPTAAAATTASDTTPSSSSTLPTESGDPEIPSTRPDVFASFQRSPWAHLSRGITNSLPYRATTTAAAGQETPATGPADEPMPPPPQPAPAQARARGAPGPAAREAAATAPLDRAGLFTFAQRLTGSATAVVAPPGRSDPWFMAAAAGVNGQGGGDADELDWEALATSAGIDVAAFPGLVANVEAGAGRNHPG
ncbi:hypothetical protein TruAng_010742 [Truncatella angustata]|nr:hypothetical protein TruAng_010742 [Truncatella angustata]